MDVDPHALSDMFAPGIHTPFQTNQSAYLMDSDTTNNGALKGNKKQKNSTFLWQSR